MLFTHAILWDSFWSLLLFIVFIIKINIWMKTYDLKYLNIYITKKYIHFLVKIVFPKYFFISSMFFELKVKAIKILIII
jgi:hypothetical protein